MIDTACRWNVPEGSGQAWTDSLFDNTQSSVARSIESIVHFTCMKASHILPCPLWHQPLKSISTPPPCSSQHASHIQVRAALARMKHNICSSHIKAD